ncbi:stress enhanced protein 1, chloroplastic [Mercurialis annua]|uniref:stress enhanced protein 1, chloroplastic n=1 Tax=Mercurialis annua TaxID=3986 RepID=UPI00215E886C|nr:stress enhanced protein 1, chloroplastic [Mercurialis annua]
MPRVRLTLSQFSGHLQPPIKRIKYQNIRLQLASETPPKKIICCCLSQVMAVASQVSASLCLSIAHSCSVSSSRTHAVFRLPGSRLAPIKTTFATGLPLILTSRTSHQTRRASNATLVSVRSEQSTQGNGLDVWLGRFAMIGFAAAISVEVATGKGLLENFGLTSPLPTVALAVTGLVGVLTAVFIFQSASEN